MSVAEGNFSFIDYSYEEGAPRDPTPVGEKTYKQLVTMFKGVTPLDKKSEFIFKHEEPKREIASIHQEVTPVVVTESKSSELESYRNNVLKNPRSNKSHVQKKETYKLEKVAIHIYGQKIKAETNTHSRMPASVKEEPASQFSPEVIHESKTQERDNLIQALKNL